MHTQIASNQIMNDIVPLPIASNNDKNEETEDETSTSPLKIESNHNLKTEIDPPAPPQLPSPPKPPQSEPKYVSPPIAPLSTQPPPLPQRRQYVTPAHLRPPPPLTPMSNIDKHGCVIVPHRPPPSNHYDLPPSVDPNEPPPPPPYDGGNGQMQYAPPPVVPSYAIEYKCKQCRIVFNTKSELLAHNHSVHRNEMPYAASPQRGAGGGGGGNGNKRGSRQQQPIGMNEQNRNRYHCNVCNRSFSGKQHFEYHMRTHSGEKPFKCNVCGKAFRAKHSLKNHTRIHTGERPYQCKVCGKWFRQLGVMKNHIKNMHSHSN